MVEKEKDIVERLHDYARGIFAEPAARNTLPWLAADEIERLRAANDKAKLCFKEAKKEIERLRRSLKLADGQIEVMDNQMRIWAKQWAALGQERGDLSINKFEDVLKYVEDIEIAELKESKPKGSA